MNGDHAATDARVLTLIRVSLATWNVAATIAAEPNGGWRIETDQQSAFRVSRAPREMPFRWLVTTTNGRERPASSIAGLLRVLRSSLDPAWRPGRARIVPLTPPAP